MRQYITVALLVSLVSLLSVLLTLELSRANRLPAALGQAGGGNIIMAASNTQKIMAFIWINRSEQRAGSAPRIA